MSAYPVLTPMDQVIVANGPDGAFYVVQGDHAQVIIVGAMYFTPGQYIEALGELLDTHYVLRSSQFMPPPNTQRQLVLDRGFVSLIASKGN